MDTRQTIGIPAPGTSGERKWAQRIWAIVALAYLLLTLGPPNVFAAARCVTPAIEASEQQALRTDRIALTGDAGRAVDEMLLGAHSKALRWDRVPELVVLMPVMQYEKVRGTQYRATAEQLTAEEADALAADLTDALSVLTDGVFKGFAAIRRETPTPGDTVNVMRPGQIVVARYQGVRDQLATIGFGGRSTRKDVIRAGSIILDNDFDRTSPTRRLLRTHELGHALGYNHVTVRDSVMNSHARFEPNAFDRDGSRFAFLRPPQNRTPDIDPDPFSLNLRIPSPPVWNGAR